MDNFLGPETDFQISKACVYQIIKMWVSHLPPPQ